MKNGLVIETDGRKYWYKNNKLHKEDGPAFEWGGPYHNEWFVEGAALNLKEEILAKKILAGKMFKKLPLYINHPKLKYFCKKVLEVLKMGATRNVNEIYEGDLSWVDWGLLREYVWEGLEDGDWFSAYDYIDYRAGKIIYGIGVVSSLMMRIGAGFNCKYTKIPLMFPEADKVTLGVLMYRLSIGR